MSTRMLGSVIVACAVFALAGCSMPQEASSLDAGDEWSPAGAILPAEVSRVGMVIDGGDGPVACLGPVMESFPPQCDGPVITGWDWDAVGIQNSEAGTRWGDYSIRGFWDGESLTLSSDAAQATHAPSAELTNATQLPSCADDADAAVLPALRDTEHDIVSVLTDLESGCVVVEVPYDDGTLQDAVDARFGKNAIVIGSSFTPVEED